LLKSVVDQYHLDQPQIPSFLLITQPGMGRETTARAVSAAIHGEYIFRHTYGQALGMGEDIYDFFKDGTENTTYYIESAELLSHFAQITLLKLLRDNILNQSLPLERETVEFPFIRGLVFLSCATTKPLFRSLLDLIDVQFRFEIYTGIDIGNVLRQRCTFMNWDITEAAQQRIATQANTPEQCIRLLTNTYRISRGRDGGATTMTKDDVQTALVHFKMMNIKIKPEEKIPF
jgi:Holliday junction resolvasome RuvABC ATP-dependent DNA helicase subunit